MLSVQLQVCVDSLVSALSGCWHNTPACNQPTLCFSFSCMPEIGRIGRYGGGDTHVQMYLLVRAEVEYSVP